MGNRIFIPGAGSPAIHIIGKSSRTEPWNDIGTPGTQGFGVGVCPVTPVGFVRLAGTNDRASDNYGNYQYSDGSIMCWVPAFYYKWGTGTNGSNVNAVDVRPYSALGSPGAAALKGYALHRAFYDGEVVQPGVFCDKYITSNNGGIASSLKNGIVLSSAARGTLPSSTFVDLNGAPTNAYYGSIAAAKTRGANFFPSSRFITSALAILSYAHAQASSNATHCAWYDAINNFPKGCNNNALGDANDAAILYVADGNGTYPGCGKTGSANLFARTTHNGQNCGVADLNGLIWEINLGLTSNGVNYYALKTAARMKDLTAGDTLATDLWGATGITTNYDSLGATIGAAQASNTYYVYGSATQVFSEALSGANWQATGAGIPLIGGVGGTNPFGNDGLWDYRPNEMCPLSGAHWADGPLAGVWALYLGNARNAASGAVGFRAALYL